MLPNELLAQIVEGCEPGSYGSLARCGRGLAGILSSEAFWQRQCLRRGYDAPIRTSVPEGRDAAASWRRRFRDHHETRKNWQLGRYKWWGVETEGQACLALDGAHNRALSAPLPPRRTVRGGCRYWDFETGESVVVVVGEREGEAEGAVTSAVFDGSVLIYGTRDGVLVGRDLRQPASVVFRHSAHAGEVAALERGDALLVSGSGDCSVVLWDVRRGGVALGRERAKGPVACLAVSPHGDVACGSADGSVLVVPAAGRPRPRSQRLDAAPFGAINSAVYHGGDLLLGSDDGHVRRLREHGTTLEALPSLAGREERAAVVCMHRSGDRLVVGSADGVLAGYDLGGGGRETLRIRNGRRIIWQVYSDASRILSAGLDRWLLVHDFGPKTRR